MARTPHRTMSHKVCIASTPVVVRGHTAELARKGESAARAMRHANGTIRRGHNPKRPYRATAASRRYTTPRCRIGRPGATASAAAAWPQAALQRLEALEPAPFVPQRLGLDLLEAPKPPTARPWVVAAACALPAARLPGAEAERSQQIALRAPDQIGAHARWARQPLFEREPRRKASCGSSPRHNLMSFENALMSFCGMRTFVLAMPLRTRALPTPRKAKPKSVAKNSSLKKKGGGAPIGACRIRIEKGCGARPFSFPLWGTEAARTSWSGRARLSAPHRGIRGFGLGSAWAALPGTTGCKREDPLRHQCSEHLAVRHAPDGTMPKPPASAVYRCARREPLPLRPKEYPRERRPFASGISVR